MTQRDNDVLTNR